ncbi:unnamed protein product [Meganyctiphanes norvegica]|uniref:Uncharacterized protein n=1 Tax=Meganyctiphanes norvegica TaxID=48144 RepID=A0AAV2PQJ6_MEGNR
MRVSGQCGKHLCTCVAVAPIVGSLSHLFALLERRYQFYLLGETTTRRSAMWVTGFTACLILAVCANFGHCGVVRVESGDESTTKKPWVIEPRDGESTIRPWSIMPRDKVDQLLTMVPEPWEGGEGTMPPGAQNDEEEDLVTEDPDPWEGGEGTMPPGAVNDERNNLVTEDPDPWHGNEGSLPPGVLN